MDVLSMMTTAAWLLAVAALGGLAMAVIRFRGVDRPPTALLMGHGVLAAAALTLLVYAAATVGLPGMGTAALGVLLVVALVGAALNLLYHSKMLPIPKTPMVIHGLVAVVGFVLLVLTLMAARQT